MSFKNIDTELLTRQIQENQNMVDFLNNIQGIPAQVAIGQILTVADTGVIDTEFVVPHTLVDSNGDPRVPNGVFVISQNKAGSLYDSGTPNTTTDIYLKFSAANGTLKLWVL